MRVRARCGRGSSSSGGRRRGSGGGRGGSLSRSGRRRSGEGCGREHRDRRSRHGQRAQRPIAIPLLLLQRALQCALGPPVCGRDRAQQLGDSITEVRAAVVAGIAGDKHGWMFEMTAVQDHTRAMDDRSARVSARGGRDGSAWLCRSQWCEVRCRGDEGHSTEWMQRVCQRVRFHSRVSRCCRALLSVALLLLLVWAILPLGRDARDGAVTRNV